MANDTARKQDINGFLEIDGNPLSKVGVYDYSGKMIDPTGAQGLERDRLYKVYRPAEELADPDCIESFKLLPWVDNHPKKLLGDPKSGAVAAEEKGVEGVIGERVFFDQIDQMLKGNIKLFSASQAKRIDDGKIELSVGYRCRYEKSSGTFNGENYDFIQRSMRGNHLASEEFGRMGPDVAVLDSLIFAIDSREFYTMAIKNPKLAQLNEKIQAAQGDIKQITSLISAYDADEEKEDEEKKKKEAADKMAKDAEEAEAKKKEDDEKAAKDAEEAEAKKKADEDKDKDKEGKGMDAKEVAKLVQSEVAKALKANAPAMDAKEMMAEISRRDALVKHLSHFVGTFDASEMTHAEVAKYGVEKLKLTAAKGQEAAVLSGYLHDRPIPGKQTTSSAMDRREGGTQNFVQKQLAQ